MSLQSPPTFPSTMLSLLRLQPRLQGSKSFLSLSHPTSKSFLSGQRAYAQKSSDSEDAETTKNNPSTTQQDSDVASPNNPIPSNKAHPTLRDGRQSPIADKAGNLRDDLPEDVKQHNEEVENRYDRPYNHTADEGNYEPAWERK